MKRRVTIALTGVLALAMFRAAVFLGLAAGATILTWVPIPWLPWFTWGIWAAAFGRVVIANADLPYVYRQLLRDQGATRRLAKLKYTCSTLMFYWGVDKPYPQLGPHNVFLAGDYRASFDRIFHDHTLPEEPSVYVHAPARIDPSAAPSGQETLMVLVPVGHLDPDANQDWEGMTARARQATFRQLGSVGLTDLEQHIKFEIAYTPETWEQNFNLEKGAALGLSHNFMQVGYLRPHNRHPRIRNLYFVGASTHPGTGVPIVLLSARLVTERILAEIGPASA